MKFQVTEHVHKTPRHTTFYLASGNEQGTPIIFVHGWPDLSISWRHQLPCFASLGFRAIAPDMRGYGRSSIYENYESYTMEHIVADMIELLDSLGHERAIWVGHDWGSPIVWSIASHHPDRCLGVANLCIPYLHGASLLDLLVGSVDRTVYPADIYPAGQWDYILFYRESFELAERQFEANIRNTVKALFRSGDPQGEGQPSLTALVRKNGGWFQGLPAAPDLPMDTRILTEEDLHTYVAALERNGFFGPDAYYMNLERNAAYDARARNGELLEIPVLFLHAKYDYICATTSTPLPEAMRHACSNLTEVVVPSGHWMAQEEPAMVNAAIVRWMALQFPELWPRN